MARRVGVVAVVEEVLGRVPVAPGALQWCVGVDVGGARCRRVTSRTTRLTALVRASLPATYVGPRARPTDPSTPTFQYPSRATAGVRCQGPDAVDDLGEAGPQPGERGAEARRAAGRARTTRPSVVRGRSRWRRSRRRRGRPRRRGRRGRGHRRGRSRTSWVVQPLVASLRSVTARPVAACRSGASCSRKPSQPQVSAAGTESPRPTTRSGGTARWTRVARPGPTP